MQKEGGIYNLDFNGCIHINFSIIFISWSESV